MEMQGAKKLLEEIKNSLNAVTSQLTELDNQIDDKVANLKQAESQEQSDISGQVEQLKTIEALRNDIKTLEKIKGDTRHKYNGIVASYQPKLKAYADTGTKKDINEFTKTYQKQLEQIEVERKQKTETLLKSYLEERTNFITDNNELVKELASYVEIKSTDYWNYDGEGVNTFEKIASPFAETLKLNEYQLELYRHLKQL